MSEKGKFISSRGVLAWGVPMFLVMTGPQVFLDRGSHPQTQSDFVFEVLLGLLVWPAAGALSGWALWVIHERQKSKNRIPGSR